MGRAIIDDLFDAIQLQINRSIPNILTSGIIMSVSVQDVQVRLVGSNTSTQVHFDDPGSLTAGQHCILARPTALDRWVIVTQFSTQKSGKPLPSGTLELAPPSNLRDGAGVPTAIHAVWDGPAASPVLFEVQTSATGVDTDVTTVLFTRGSDLIVPSDSSLYVRVRSINDKFQPSSWSAFVAIAPGTQVSVGQYEQFVYLTSGGDFTFVIDLDGNPVFTLVDLE